MSFISTLTWSCIKLQGLIKNPELEEEEKNNLVLNHLNSVEESSRDVFPEFQPGWEWFNTSRSLSVSSDFKDQIVVVDFFTYCCINCMHILPDLHALEEKFPSDQSGVVVVGIHSAKFENEKVSSNIMAAVQRYGIAHPVVNDSEAVLWKTLEITCWPTLLILGPDRKPVFVIIGEGHRDVLFRYVDCALTFYKNRIIPRPLPLLPKKSEVFQSQLLFPGKICIIECECVEVPTVSGGPKQDSTYLAIADTGHHRILITSLQGEIKVTVGGEAPGWKEGSYATAQFHSPQGIAFLPPCYLYVADTGNHSVRLVNLKSKEVNTVAGKGVQGTDKEGGQLGTEQPLASPWDVCLAHSSNSDDPDLLIIANAGTHQIWGLALRDLTWWKKMHLEAGRCLRLAGSGAEENRNNSYPAKAAFAQPSGISCGVLQSPSADYLLFVADSESSSIRQINLKDGSVKALVGGGKDPMDLFCFGDQDNYSNPKGAVLLQHPLGVAWSTISQILYVADSYNHKIKLVNPLTKVCSTYLGNGKPGFADGGSEDEIQFNEPGGLCIHEEQRILYVADTNNHCIRKVDLVRSVTETLKISVKLSAEETQTLISNTVPSFEVSATLAPRSSNFNWTVKFHCADQQWKWSDDAPHSWKITHIEGLTATDKMGHIQDSLMKIDLLCGSLQESNGPNNYVQVQADLFLCAIKSGVCKKKSVIIRLNFVLNENTEVAESKIQHEFDINAD